MTTDEVEYFQMVTWYVSTPQQKNFSPPLHKVDAEQTLESMMNDGCMDGFIRPYPEESGGS
jgi:hypothetical protein